MLALHRPGRAGVEGLFLAGLQVGQALRHGVFHGRRGYRSALPVPEDERPLPALLLDQFDEGAQVAFGVDEGHRRAPGSGPGGLVDDPTAARPSPAGGRPRSRPPGSRRGGGPRPCSPGTWPPASRPGWGRGAGRRNRPRSGGPLRPRRSRRLPVGHLGAEPGPVVVDGGIEVTDGDGHVVDVGQHVGRPRRPRRLSRARSCPVPPEQGDPVLAHPGPQLGVVDARDPQRGPGRGRRSFPRGGCGGPGRRPRPPRSRG